MDKLMTLSVAYDDGEETKYFVYEKSAHDVLRDAQSGCLDLISVTTEHGFVLLDMRKVKRISAAYLTA